MSEQLKTRHEKSQSEVTEQINRMGIKLNQRARRLGRGIVATNTDKNEIKMPGEFIKHEKTSQGLHARTDVNGKDVSHTFEKTVIRKRVEDGYNTHELHHLTGKGTRLIVNGNRMDPSLEQSIHLTAGTLANVRDELAQREVAHNTDVQGSIDTLRKV